MSIKQLVATVTGLLLSFTIQAQSLLPLPDDLLESLFGKAKSSNFTFVGKVDECGTGYPAGSRIVTSAWIKGLGLPDNGGLNFTPGDPTNNPNKSDNHTGLLLSKNGTTADCSSAGLTLKKVKGTVVTATYALGYDYRIGGHCGAGAPRFNVDTDVGFFFVGCANAPQSPAPQNPAEWNRTRSVLSTCGSECFPGPIPVGAVIKSINIIYDEGTDASSVDDPEGSGMIVLDNLFINGQFIRR